MMTRFASLLLLVFLTGCGLQAPATQPTAVSAAATPESSAEAAMLNRLKTLLDHCLAAAKQATTAREAESAAHSVYERWKQGERGATQFAVQAQRTGKGGIQIQLQVQLTDGSLSIQAQKQASF